MQERSYDGGEKLTPNATVEDFLKAMGNADNKMVAMHRPGSEVILSDGSRYIIQPDGAWKKVIDNDAAQE